ncbi:hypothetical protein SSX86_000394 [Deinandra increscens subsp. villosa]|uniref:Transposase (putative) gypsy type domain-containing protein n=1 Tax=Deinandra increscens subsp. villosa TaxID=3103831 RepID=A0AAP0DT27_9ASTR
MSSSSKSSSLEPSSKVNDSESVLKTDSSKPATKPENPKIEKIPTKHNLSISFCSISQEDLDAFVEEFQIPLDLNPILPSAGKPIYPFPANKIGLYFDFFKQANYRIPFTSFLFKALDYFGIHITQCNPPGLSILNHFELACRALEIPPNVTLFRAFYRLTMAGNWYTFEKRRDLNPICSSKPPTNRLWKNQFFYLDHTCVPTTMTWRDPKFAIRDDAPKKETVNQKHFSRISELSFPVRKLPEGILVAAQISTNWHVPHLRPSLFNEGAKMDLSGVLKLRDFSSLTFESAKDPPMATPVTDQTGATSSNVIIPEVKQPKTQENESAQNPPIATTKRKKHTARGHHESPKKDEIPVNKKSKKEPLKRAEKSTDADVSSAITQGEKPNQKDLKEDPIPRRSPRHNVQHTTSNINDSPPTSETQMSRLADVSSPPESASFNFEMLKDSPLSPPSLSHMITNDDITINEYFSTSPPATLEITEKNPSFILTSDCPIIPPAQVNPSQALMSTNPNTSSSNISTFLPSSQNEVEWLKNELALVKTRRTAGYNLGELFLPSWNISNKDTVTDSATAKNMFLHCSTPNDVKFLQSLPPSVLAARVTAIHAESQSIIPELYNRWIRAENANLSSEISQMQNPVMQNKIQGLEKEKVALAKAKNDASQKRIMAELALNEARSMIDMLKKQQMILEKKNSDTLSEAETLLQEKQLLTEQKQTISNEAFLLKEKLSQQQHEFEERQKALEMKVKILTEEKQVLENDRSWLLKEGVDAVVRKLFKDPDMISAVGNINNAMNTCGVNEGLILGFQYANMPASSVLSTKEFDRDANKKLSEATEAFKRLHIPFLKQLSDLHNAPLQAIKDAVLGDEPPPHADKPGSTTDSHPTPSGSV